MWACPKCRESVEDNYDVCWNCGTARDGSEDTAFTAVDPEIAAEMRKQADEEPTPKGSTSDEVFDEAREQIASIRGTLTFLSAAFFALSALSLILLCLDIRARIVQQAMNGLASLLKTISIQEIVGLVGHGAFAALFLGIGCFIWQYRKRLCQTADSDEITISYLLNLQRLLWKDFAVITTIAFFVGILTYLCVVNMI